MQAETAFLGSLALVSDGVLQRATSAERLIRHRHIYPERNN